MSCQSRHSHLLSSLPSVLVILVFSLVAVPVAAQTFTVLHSFTGYGDGSLPTAGLTADGTGNFYGTATSGGTNNHGTVFKLSSAGSGWVVTPIYSFQAGTDGAYPQARVVFGPDGTLYGTTTFGGALYGTVFNLRPPAAACKTALCPWTETVLYRFTGGSDGAYPELGDLTFDSSGNIYGTTGGGAGTSTVFKLSRSGQSWTFSVLYTFTCGNDGCEPYSGVIFDQAGTFTARLPKVEHLVSVQYTNSALLNMVGRRQRSTLLQAVQRPVQLR